MHHRNLKKGLTIHKKTFQNLSQHHKSLIISKRSWSKKQHEKAWFTPGEEWDASRNDGSRDGCDAVRDFPLPHDEKQQRRKEVCPLRAKSHPSLTFPWDLALWPRRRRRDAPEVPTVCSDWFCPSDFVADRCHPSQIVLVIHWKAPFLDFYAWHGTFSGVNMHAHYLDLASNISICMHTC